MKRTLLGMSWLMTTLFSLSAAGAGEGSKPSSEYNLLYVPTPQIVVDRMLEIADVNGSDVVYDLGCGDGRIVITAAKRYGTKGIGVDLNPERIKESRKNAKKAGVTERVEFYQKDVFNTDISDATVVTLYLLPEVMEKLPPKLMEELDPGTRIVSHDFDLPNWEANRTIQIGGSDESLGSIDTSSDGENDLYEFNVDYLELTPKEKRQQMADLTTSHTLYYWVVPAQLEGEWQMTFSTKKQKRQCRVHFKQQYQDLGGHVRWAPGKKASIKKGGIDGKRVEFMLKEKLQDRQVTMRFSGRAKHDTLRGEVKMVGPNGIQTRQWQARKLSR